MTPEQLYSIVAYLCTQGEQSDCDLENVNTAIPDAIKTAFDFDVDITFGMEDSEAMRCLRRTRKQMRKATIRHKATIIRPTLGLQSSHLKS